MKRALLILILCATTAEAQQIIVPSNTSKSDTVRAYKNKRITVKDSIFYEQYARMTTLTLANALDTTYSNSVSNIVSNHGDLILSTSGKTKFLTLDTTTAITGLATHGFVVAGFYGRADTFSIIASKEWINDYYSLVLNTPGNLSNVAYKSLANSFTQRNTFPGITSTGSTDTLNIVRFLNNLTAVNASNPLLTYQSYISQNGSSVGSGIFAGVQDTIISNRNTQGGDVVVGGFQNVIHINSSPSDVSDNAIVGGRSNGIGGNAATGLGKPAAARYNFIGGGLNNFIQAYQASAIIGGAHDTIWGSAPYVAIIGGTNNTIGTNGASTNVVQTSVIIGGSNNFMTAPNTTKAVLNSMIVGAYDTVYGGNMNYMFGNNNLSDATYDNGYGNWLFGQFLHVQGKGSWVMGSDDSFTKKVIPFPVSFTFYGEPIQMWTNNGQSLGSDRVGFAYQSANIADSVRYGTYYMKRGSNTDTASWASFDIGSRRYFYINGSGALTPYFSHTYLSFNYDSLQGIVFNPEATDLSTRPYGDVKIANGNFLVQNGTLSLPNSNTLTGISGGVSMSGGLTLNGNLGMGTNSITAGDIHVPTGYALTWGGTNDLIYGDASTHYVIIRTNGSDRFMFGSDGALTLGAVLHVGTGSLYSGAITSTITSGDNITINKGSGPSIFFNKTDATTQGWIISTDPDFRVYDATAGRNDLIISASTGAATVASTLTVNGATLLGSRLVLPPDTAMYFTNYAGTQARWFRSVAVSGNTANDLYFGDIDNAMNGGTVYFYKTGGTAFLSVPNNSSPTFSTGLNINGLLGNGAYNGTSSIPGSTVQFLAASGTSQNLFMFVGGQKVATIGWGTPLGKGKSVWIGVGTTTINSAQLIIDSTNKLVTMSGNITVSGTGTNTLTAGKTIIGQLQVNANASQNIALNDTITSTVGVLAGNWSLGGGLTLSAGTSSVAALKMTSGTVLSSPTAGAWEYDGTNLIFTPGSGVRDTLTHNIGGGGGGGTNNVWTRYSSSGGIYQATPGDKVHITTVAGDTTGTSLLTVAGTSEFKNDVNISSGVLKIGGTTTIDASRNATLGTITGTFQGTAIADAYISSASTWNAKQAAYTNLTTIGSLADAAGWLHDDGAGTFAYSTPTKSDVGLSNVENTALSTWAGTSNITTLGTITAGTIGRAYIAGLLISDISHLQDSLTSKQHLIAGTGFVKASGSTISYDNSTYQVQLSGTGFVKASGTTISYDNSTYLTSFTETDPVVAGKTGIITSNGSTISSITDNSGNWNTAYTQSERWNGGATDLVPATARASLGLGNVALVADSTRIGMHDQNNDWTGQNSFSTPGNAVDVEFNTALGTYALNAYQVNGVNKGFLAWNIDDGGTISGTSMLLYNNQGKVNIWDNSGTGIQLAGGSAAIAGSLTAGGTVTGTTGLVANATGTNYAMLSLLNTNGVLRSGKTAAGVGADEVQLYNNGLGLAVAYGGRVLVGTSTDDGVNALQVNGNIAAGLYNGQTISSSANFTGTLTTAGLIKRVGSVAGDMWMGLVNTNTAQSEGIYFGEVDDGSTPAYIRRAGSTQFGEYGLLELHSPYYVYVSAPLISNSYIASGSYINTEPPTANGAGTWKLGKRISAGKTFDNLHYLEVMVDGSVYYIALVQ